MPASVVTVPYGRAALAALRDVAAAAKRADPMAPVTVVVPSNLVGLSARRQLAWDGLGARGATARGLVGMTFATPYRLAELLGAARLAATGRRPASQPVIAAALRRALAEDPGGLGPVAGHPATEAALVGAFALLSDVSARGLAGLAGADPRTADVVRLCCRARDILADDWYDETDLVDAATDAVLSADLPGDEPNHLVVYLPQDVNLGQARLLRATAERWPTTVIAALTGAEPADAGVRRSLDRLGLRSADADRARTARPGAADPPRSPGSATGQPSLPVGPDRTRLLTASDADEEVRAAVRAVLDAARAGTPLDRIAVLFSTPEPYARLVHEHFAAAGIPRNGAALRPLSATAYGRMLLDLLALGDHDFRRSDVLALLAQLPPGPLGGRRSGEWERLSRRAGVVAGPEDWDRLLDRLAAGLEARADAEVAAGDVEPPTDPRPPAARDEADEDTAERHRSNADRLRRRAGTARELRAVVLELTGELEGAGSVRRPWPHHVAWLERLASRLSGGPTARSEWPAEERRAAERVDAALARLAALDRVDGPVDLAVFRRTFALELDADLGRVGRFGDGVLVAPLSFSVGLDLDLVVVLGLAEGRFPATVHDDVLLRDEDRRRADGELPLRRDRVGLELRHLHAALAGAARHLLCVPRGDLRSSQELVPSRWLVAAAAFLRGEALTAPELLAQRADWIEHVPSYAHAVTHAAFPPTEQDYRLAAGRRSLDDPVAAPGAAAVRARRSRRFTRFDGNLAGVDLSPPHEGIVSPTRLETWAACPHAYLVRYLLDVEPTEDPERQLALSALDRGSLVHEVLERFIRSVLDRPEQDRPAPEQPWSAEDHATMAELARRMCDDYEARGLTGRPVFWRRDRAQVLSLVDRFLREDSEHRRRTRTRPWAAELAFGHADSTYGPVEMALDDGRRLAFRGTIDRVDRGADGTPHVTDYKTGSARTYASLAAEDPDQRGTSLQLAVYAAAARAAVGDEHAPVRAEYWFVTDREGFARKGYLVDDDVLRRVGATLGTIARGIEQGVFPARPDDTGGARVACRYCDPDGLGVVDLRRDWERKRDDPSVAAYAELAEPQAPAQLAHDGGGGSTAP